MDVDIQAKAQSKVATQIQPNLKANQLSPPSKSKAVKGSSKSSPASSSSGAGGARTNGNGSSTKVGAAAASAQTGAATGATRAAVLVDQELLKALPTLSGLVSSAAADITKGADVPTEGAAKKLILLYLRQQNRPYSAMQLFDNLHHRVLKSRVESVCESLAEDAASGVLVKEYGKAKLYYPNQYMLSGLPTNVEALREENERAAKELTSRQKEEKQRHDELKAMAAQPCDADLDDVLSAQEATCVALAAQAEKLGGANLAPDACENAVRRFNFYRSKWAQRRSVVMDLVGSIADGMEKKTAVVADQIGVVTDTEAKHALPEQLAMPKT